MCDPVSIGMAVVAVAGAAMAEKDKAKAAGNAEDARRKSQIELIKQNNIANADLALEAKDKAEVANQQMTEINLTAIRNKGMLAAAIGESGLAGNSMDRLKRVTAAETSHEKMAVLDNYQRDYQTIFANQVGNVDNTKSQLNASAPVARPSKVAAALNVTAAGMGGYAQGSALGGPSKTPTGGGASKAAATRKGGK